MENNNNSTNSVQPPFEMPTGGSLVQNKPTGYQKKYYDDALKYAIANKDDTPDDFARSMADSTAISYGKNNPFGDLASKYQPGTIKDGIKYRDYPSSNTPISKKYLEYLQNKNNSQLEDQQSQNMLQNMTEGVPQETPNNNFEQTQGSEMPQQEISQPTQSMQGQPISMPNTAPTSLSVYDKNYSDQTAQSNNPVSQLNATNPIQNAMGGRIGKTDDKNLNSFNVGGTHEQSPLGGIPQGVGSNGRQNTVEQDETSLDIDGQKFIFSNRIFL